MRFYGNLSLSYTISFRPHSMHYARIGSATTQTSGRGGKCMISAFAPGAGDGRAAAGDGAQRVGGGFSRRKRFLRDGKTPPHRLEPFWLPLSGSLTVLHARSRIPHHLARFFAARRAQVWAVHRHQHRLGDYQRARKVAHDVFAPGYYNICPVTARWR